VGASAATPRNIIDGIAAEVGKLATLSDTKERLAVQGFEPCHNNPEQTASVIKRDIEQYAAIIRENGIKTER
jgi:tripartite-type tricarboxylate transporter receptor subunit TctC